MEAGEKLGRYEIRRKIGEGGMGEVYLAYDEQLDRDVVLKILLSKFSEDTDLVNRFKLEAKAVSALNHPNIITIYEIAQTENLSFIVYEYIKGTTLREKIIRNQLTIAESINIIEQIGKGLAAAHSANIIHRDIKPENIMIRDDGYVRILDFGLAKRRFIEAEDASHTAQMVKTKEGMIMGSVQYMSPEQARGEKIDERTDIWSLGVVFYEMLTGKCPFAGKTMSDSIALVLQSEPPLLAELNPQIPQNLQKVINNSLKKNRNERYQNINHFLLELHGLNVPKDQASTNNETVRMDAFPNSNEANTNQQPTAILGTQVAKNVETNEQNVKTVASTDSILKSKTFKIATFAVIPLLILITGFLALAGFGGWYYYSNYYASVPFKEAQVEPLTKDKNADLVSMTADGKQIVYVKNFSGNQMLTLRQMDSGKETDLTKAQNGLFSSVNISEDGKTVYYVLEGSGDGTLYKIPASGGKSEKIGENMHSGITLSPDSQKFAYLRLNASENIARVFVANTDGSDLKELVSTKDIGYNSFLGLDWSPDGKKMFLVALGKQSENAPTISVGTVDIDVSKEPMSSKEFKVLNKDGWRAVQSAKWLADGSGIIFIGGKSADKTKQIYHLAFPSGKVTRITNDTSNYSSLDVAANASILVASKANILSSLWKIDVESNNAKQISPETETLLNFVDISQTEDGRLYYSKLEGENVNIYSVDADGKNTKQVTSGGWNMGAYVTPDDKYLLTTAKTKDGYYGIVRMNLDGSDAVQLTRIKDKMDLMPQVTPDGKIVFMRVGLDWSFPKLMKVNLIGGETSNVINDNQKLEMYPKISPDGKYLAFVNFFADSSANQVRMKMKVVEFNEGKVGETVLEKDIDQVTRFAWSEDNKKLIYLEPNKKMNLISLSLSDKKETPLTDFNSRVMEGAFTFSKDYKNIFAVRSADNRELVLIKDASKTKK